MSEYATQEQPAPQDGTGPDAWLLVIEDMKHRRTLGIERYRRPLRHDNGRDHLVDAYQEALDLAVYLRNEIEARKEKAKTDRLYDAILRAGFSVQWKEDADLGVITSINEDSEWLIGRGRDNTAEAALIKAVLDGRFGSKKLDAIARSFNLS